MKNAFYETATGIATAIALFASGVALGHIVNRLPIASGDAATWTGALLAGLAFGGTITLASQESRRRNRERRLLARIIIPRVVMKLVRLKSAFERASAELKHHTYTKAIVVTAAGVIKVESLWSAEDAVALAHLGNDCASQLMLIKEISESVALKLEFAPNNWNAVAADSVTQLDRGVELINSCLLECNREYDSSGL